MQKLKLIYRWNIYVALALLTDYPFTLVTDSIYMNYLGVKSNHYNYTNYICYSK